MRALERYLLLQIIDQRWREHLYDMDYLREGIHLRGFAQIDPLVAYKNEAFELFADLMNTIWADFARHDLQRRGRGRGPGAGAGRGAAAAATRRPGGSTARRQRLLLRRRARSAAPRRSRWLGGAAAGAAAEAYADGELEAAELPHVEQRRVDENEQIGRNDPCWCGSGKKFKKCHGA